MARVLSVVFVLLNCGLVVDPAQAQLRGYGAPPAAREPARVGLLGGIREAREERFRREAQAAAAAARAANPNAGRAANPNAAAQNTAAQNAAAARNATAANNLLQRNPNANQRTANYGSANNGSANNGTANRPSSATRTPNVNASSVSSAMNSGLNANREPSYVAPASANTFVPSPMRGDSSYDGPGVTIRLPRDARGVVNYLIDDVENSTVRPGEEQVLGSKPSFIVRYSRGVTSDGRSFGESRYTVTEGIYRFELTSSGWELYRESDANNQELPPNRLEIASDELLEPSRESLEGAREESPKESQREESLATELPMPAESSSAAADPTPAAEELPAPKPRSILEK